ncbi:TVP38/TMEM64 family protein [Enterococcus thailandicus]|uniref:TVP38/TMEM64 family membrane protein n=1 Tax=Enterococcus thailandicus TaxID=417368 RepID=A0A1L8XKP4_ENTTH|nr:MULTISPECIES: VTT domain-containing protein [Enterococcus]ASZ07090.1 TVP38/TMEM64 family protein [Enterococcus thailandicus]MDA3964560.1 VTT domain-containing protein [Enterococcus thailandicus]MDK4352404.1 VTT domain-containing protein [Enterococcus thailandicus]MDT2735187.1 VTT domain-containing protein [Enterococcus thailandicus]MDT2845438.1 VTT domain-containing protein [Enterococcus thailandicus]
MSVAASRKLINFISIIGLGASIALTVYFINLGVFKDINALRGLVGHSVILGPVIFILIQILQVVIPIIPGGISTAAGVLIFGPYAGFVYNYVGICIGSVIIFLLGRRYGKPFILSLISDKTYDKYIGWLDNQSRFEKLFALAIFLPVAPDDALCLMAGLTNISVKKFSLIIFLAKPLSIFLYSMALIYGGQYLTGLLG